MSISLKESLQQIVLNNSKTSELVRFDHDINLPTDLGFDSIMLMKLITDIENEYDLVFDIEELEFERFCSFDALLHTVQSKIQRKGES
ncbi:hypothetical protein GCM10010912_59760 [Paenibacillus albidus]|uniref:Carrier domain-containing protein n=1 Tax=Paenibacillus albidus TaxID=2041023 RepID=A0A917D1H1_9BACL|nr:acyl carrier protein [Paenibacillus albidus]GGG07153.1 hypothetical protein GCM10010912_59760 [Paenibacillus albidus]